MIERPPPDEWIRSVLVTLVPSVVTLVVGFTAAPHMGGFIGALLVGSGFVLFVWGLRVRKQSSSGHVLLWAASLPFLLGLCTIGYTHVIDESNPATSPNLVNLAKPETELETTQNHVTLGIEAGTLNPDYARSQGLGDDDQGVLVGNVVPGSPADLAGIETNDIIRACGGNPVAIWQSLVSCVQNAGKTVQILILHDGIANTRVVYLDR